VIAGHGWYHTRLVHQVPWMPIAIAGFTATLLGLSRIPVVTRALTAPGMASRLLRPHSFRVAGVAFLIYMALGHLPALFALPAGLGDIATGLAAPLVARRLAAGTGRRAAVRFTALGLTDLVVALTLGAVTGFGVPTVAVPLLIALHITSLVALRRSPLPAASAIVPRVAAATHTA
jgi:hypothetical protein